MSWQKMIGGMLFAPLMILVLGVLICMVIKYWPFVLIILAGFFGAYLLDS